MGRKKNNIQIVSRLSLVLIDDITKKLLWFLGNIWGESSENKQRRETKLQL